MKEYDVFIPLRHNDGTLIEGRILRQLQSKLLEHFGGLTYFPQPNQGFWKLGDVTYRDDIVVYRVLTSDTRRSRSFFRELKQQLKAELSQEEILIVERDVEAL